MLIEFCMKKIWFVFICFLSLKSFAQQPWPPGTQTSKPWTRWWWMGSAVDSVNILREINMLGEAGFGGVEIVPIYGAKGYEDKYINYLSPAWLNTLDYTVKTANDAGLGVYIAAGTGWPIGGLQVLKEDAAAKLVVQQYTLNADSVFNQKIIAQDSSKLGALLAYKDDDLIEDITNKVTKNGSVNWLPSTKGEYALYALFDGKTGQKVKRAARAGKVILSIIFQVRH